MASRMTPTQFKAARNALGLSQNEMARALGLSSGRTIRSYELGERTITGPVKRLLAIALEDVGIVPERYGLPTAWPGWPNPPLKPSPDQQDSAPAA